MLPVRSVPFWWRWVAANSAGELVGLGGVAALGYLASSLTGEHAGVAQTLGMAILLVLAGSFEGFVLGYFQANVLKLRIPMLEGWVKGTVVGTVVAWGLGMMPSTIMNLLQIATSEPTPIVSTGLRMIMAAGLGLVAGPVLAYFQWRVLRHYVPKAHWWLPANALAWAVGMPIIFAGVHVVVNTQVIALAVLAAGATIFAAGAAVGGIHGVALLLLCPNGVNRAAASLKLAR
jgi:hypothetical protein